MLLGVVVENICCGRHLFKKKKTTLPFVDLFKRSEIKQELL